MPINLKFSFNIVKHKVQNFPKEKLNQYILSLKDGFYDIVIKKHIKTRSNKQNAYYWGVIIKILCEYFGYFDYEMHDALKWKFLFIPGEDGKLDRCGSTKKMDTKKFEDFIEQIRLWANIEHEQDIPKPNEIDYDELDYQ